MKLREYLGKNIKVFYKDGTIVEGKCDDYTHAYDNDPEIDNISIDIGTGVGVLIFENYIKTIEVIPFFK